jgi:predicted DCC family thiol-disulfide oxidoreductase YuxK
MKSTHQVPLIAPAVLIFDGDCAVCTSSADWAQRHVKTEVQIVPWQRTDLAAYGLTPEDASAAAWWISPDGRRYRGHLAVSQTLRHSNAWLRPAGWLLSVPPFSWVAALVYMVVARYRHHLPGATPACRLPASN